MFTVNLRGALEALALANERGRSLGVDTPIAASGGGLCP